MSKLFWRLKINVANGLSKSFSIEYLSRENEWIELDEYDIIRFKNKGFVDNMIFDKIDELVHYGYVQAETVVEEKEE